MKRSERSEAAARVYTELRQLIMSGDLKPRERVTETQVATLYGVSRAPVREAVARLVSEGLLAEAHRSIIVADVNMEDIRDIYQMRVALESFGVRQAAPHLADEDFAALDQLITHMAECEAEADYRQLSGLTTEFHWRLIAKCGNKRLLDQCQSLLEHSQRFRTVTMFFTERGNDTAARHRGLLSILREGDGDEVEVSMRRHLAEAASFIHGGIL